MKRHKLEIIGGQIDWKNFAGAERTANVNGRMQVVNAEGKRGFAAIIDPENSEVYFDDEPITDPDFGQTLANMGYRVSVRPGREEGDRPTYRLPVEVRYPDDKSDNPRYVPQMYLVKPGRKPILLDENSVHQLDEVDILKANLCITNSTSIDRNTGEERAKTWCNEAYFWINQSRISMEFEDMPEE